MGEYVCAFFFSLIFHSNEYGNVKRINLDAGRSEKIQRNCVKHFHSYGFCEKCGSDMAWNTFTDLMHTKNSAFVCVCMWKMGESRLRQRRHKYYWIRSSVPRLIHTTYGARYSQRQQHEDAPNGKIWQILCKKIISIVNVQQSNRNISMPLCVYSTAHIRPLERDKTQIRCAREKKSTH